MKKDIRINIIHYFIIKTSYFFFKYIITKINKEIYLKICYNSLVLDSIY